MSELVAEVKKVEAHWTLALPGDAPNLVIGALGDVSTSGWSNPNLVKIRYVTTPADGVQDFDFFADPPGGFASDVVQPILALEIDTVAPWVKGIRVRSATNAIERMF